MQIEVSKCELAGALSALGKLVCRTSPVEVYRSLRIEGKGNKLSFQTVGLDEAITCTLHVLLAPREFSSAMPDALCFFRKNREIALPERVRAGILFGKGEVLRRNDRDWHQQRRPVKNVEAPEFMVLV